VYWDYARHFETTDDAFIDSRQFGVAPKVSGYVTAVLVTDNQHVRAGEVIARIDDRDYRNAADQAEAEVAAAKATIQNIDAQIEARQAETDEAAAQEKQAQAALEFAEAEARRYQFLALRGSGTVQRAQQANSDLKQRQADLARAKAALAAAERQIAALRAQRAGAAASLARAKAQAAQAKLNLEYTAVTAAQAGRAVRLTAAAGQYAQTGQSLTMFVPDTIWVTANYKETQVDRMRPGNPVSISIDAYPKRKVHGHVDSIQPGSGTAFSLLPAENATGNYVKVVQRVPVKIAMEDAPADVALGPGMSAVPVARVRPDRSLFERITGQR
jgi:membrane fusion protein (multidrug efflux system)